MKGKKRFGKFQFWKRLTKAEQKALRGGGDDDGTSNPGESATSSASGGGVPTEPPVGQPPDSGGI